MTKQTEAMKLALEWIEAQPEPRMLGASKTITALREALDEPGQEPVAAVWVEPDFWDHCKRVNCGTAYRLPAPGRQPLYTAPPRREWVSLTFGEQTEIIERYYDDEIDFHDFARAIEAKLKEKNHGA